ncbi:hypothetical protein PY254_14585 [Rhodanobacter sp. AS-Z3]|uniref:hypothetical protein n=1 Tax=Rhodanobacter sp. AS-Z3 TaxID=3031330 RepID=UPI00247903CC|nr:hypothetical protein [Rhodanobacter sp. AS-Z3]WEN14447.1 hypothetical protein PY254_14585 [Rhodanobacter sp. AS-Z3]
MKRVVNHDAQKERTSGSLEQAGIRIHDNAPIERRVHDDRQRATLTTCRQRQVAA